MVGDAGFEIDRDGGLWGKLRKSMPRIGQGGIIGKNRTGACNLSAT